MASVTWIKIMIEMFGNPKIKYIRNLPEGNNITLMWIMLLTMAGRCNAAGVVFLTKTVPYTTSMLAAELGFQEATVQLGLRIMEQLNMIAINEGFLTIIGWNEYQNIEGLEKIKEQNRLRQEKYREKQKLLTHNVNVTLRNETELDNTYSDNLDEIENIDEKVDTVVKMYHEICSSFPKLKRVTASRKEKIHDCLGMFSIEEIKNAFAAAESSSYLKGDHDGSWTVDFEWILKPDHMTRILEGRYMDRKKNGDSRFGERKRDEDEGWAIQRMLQEELFMQ